MDNEWQPCYCSVETIRAIPYYEYLIYFIAILSHLKLQCLENEKKEAKQIYQNCLDAYTKDRLGRPLEKLHVRP